MTITLDGPISEDLIAYCSMAGKSPQEAATEMLNQELSRYRSKKGRIEIRKASYKNSEKDSSSEKPCYILDSTTIYGRPYYRILDEGRALSVPEELVVPVSPG